VTRIDGLSNDPARIDSFKPKIRVFARSKLEVPPRDSIFRADNDRTIAKKGFKLRRKLSEAMGFHPEDDYVDLASILEPLDNFRARLEVTLVAQNANAVRLHRAQMCPARKKRHVFASPVHAGSQIRANRARAGDQEFHLAVPAKDAATAPR
jgi:hypothetical protein